MFKAIDYYKGLFLSNQNLLASFLLANSDALVGASLSLCLTLKPMHADVRRPLPFQLGYKYVADR